MDVSIVSGTYNRIEHLQHMVASARASCEDLSYEIVLVDGGSTDGTLEWAKSQDDVKLIEQGELLGAIKAFNAGCEAAQGDYVVILNDDIEVVEDTIARAWRYMEHNPQVGQVAFENHVVGPANHSRRSRYGRAFGYLYGQCCMTQRWLGDEAGWWGTEGMHTYGGDTRLSMRLWEMGWPTVAVPKCAITDWVVNDALRQRNDGDRRELHQGQHPDTLLFMKVWKGRLPPPNKLIPHPAAQIANLVLERAARGTLRTLRSQGAMLPKQELRHGMMDVMANYGPTHTLNRRALIHQHGRLRFQWVIEQEVAKFRPDLIILQAQRKNSVSPETIWRLRDLHPDTLIINWNGDVHKELTPFHFDIAKAAHLQLTISPDLFPQYVRAGAANIGYWPISLEEDYIVKRASPPSGPDVIFLGALYGIGQFPEALTRRDAVLRLAESELNFSLYGPGWEKVGLRAPLSREEHAANAELMARAKMTLSVSQSADLWGYTSDRLYNICATGCPALVQRFNGMRAHGYVDGETCIAWKTLDEMMEKVRYYLAHDKERERIGQRGKEMTLARHTWAHRVEGLFTLIAGLRKEKL